MELTVMAVTLCIIAGALAAIVYSLRILVILERRIARMDINIETLVKQVMAEELKIEKRLGGRRKKK